MSKSHKKCKDGEKFHEENHICRIILTGDLDKIKKMVDSPQYICRNCGRAANSEANICRSTKI